MAPIRHGIVDNRLLHVTALHAWRHTSYSAVGLGPALRISSPDHAAEKAQWGCPQNSVPSTPPTVLLWDVCRNSSRFLCSTAAAAHDRAGSSAYRRAQRILVERSFSVFRLLSGKVLSSWRSGAHSALRTPFQTQCRPAQVTLRWLKSHGSVLQMSISAGLFILNQTVTQMSMYRMTNFWAKSSFCKLKVRLK